MHSGGVSNTEPTWDVLQHGVRTFFVKRSRYCLVIPVLNEGERIRSLLTKAQNYTREVDIIIADKGSTDGSLDDTFLASVGVRTLLTLKAPGRLSAQLRMAYAWALGEGYEGIVTIDGNDKDDVNSLPEFIAKLDEGYDFVQASRYIEGGEGMNTPLIRHLAVTCIHTPLIAWVSGFPYTDTTQGYRAYSKRVLEDARVAPFRSIFIGYELLGYLSVRIPELRYRVIEVPTTRTYPRGGKVPTKISFIKGNYQLLKILFDLVLHRYDPK
jgi:dolichol-phosphate mannosyltransferase